MRNPVVLIVIVVLILALFSPFFGYHAGWYEPYHTGGFSVGGILFVVLVLALLGLI